MDGAQELVIFLSTGDVTSIKYIEVQGLENAVFQRRQALTLTSHITVVGNSSLRHTRLF